MRTFVTNIDEKEFNDFCLNSPTNHYTKTTLYGKFKEIEHFSYFTCGIKEDNQLIASALILRKRIWYLNSYYCYITYGYNLDYNDKELLSLMNKEVIRYCKDELKACFVRIDPNVPRREHNKDGSIKEDGFNNEWLTDLLIKDGFTHLGYNYGYSGNWMSRYTLVVDLHPSIEEIKKNIKQLTKDHRKNEERSVTVREASKSDLKILYDAQLELAEKDKFIPKSLKYFERFYDIFKDYGYYYVSEADLTKAHDNLVFMSNEMQKQNKDVTNPTKLKEKEAAVNGLLKEIRLMEENHYPEKGIQPLGGKYFLIMNDKVFNIYLYTFKIPGNFHPNLDLHLKSLEICKEKNALSYDFEGISGSLDKKDPYYGLYEFKKRFNGDFIEFCGEFDAIFNEKKYKAFRKIDRYYRKIRLKLYLLVKGNL